MSTLAPSLHTAPRRVLDAAPLPALLGFTFCNATAAGLVTTGLFFAARGEYAFTRAGNYGLGVVLGAAYTAGALLSARLVQRFGGRARRVAVGLVAALALATTWPMLLSGRPLALWLVAGTYGITAAMLWPIVHSYVTGGRSGRALRGAVARFNLTWGSALVFGYGCLGPSLEVHPEATLAALGALHVASLALLRALPGAPVGSGSTEPAVEPDARALELRRVFQALLPITNLLGFALAPFLPDAFARLGLPEAHRAQFAVAWLLPRAVVFGLMGRWQGWHGRTGTAIAGAAALLCGFTLAVLAPWVARGTLGLVLEGVGLCAFGTGMAIVYTAAFYYAQAVGRAAVGAGGRHEALLGAGATLGPALGIAIVALIGAGALPAGSFEPVLAVACGLIALALCARAAARRAQPPGNR